MDPGSYRHRVKIQRPVVTRDDFGDAQRTWEVVPNGQRRAAFVKPLAGRELERARQLESEVTHEVRMRWTPELTTACRIVFRDRVLEVAAVINIEETGKDLLAMCVEASDTDEAEGGLVIQGD